MRRWWRPNGQAGLAAAAQTRHREQPAFRTQEARRDVHELLCPTDKWIGIPRGIMFDHDSFTRVRVLTFDFWSLYNLSVTGRRLHIAGGVILRHATRGERQTVKAEMLCVKLCSLYKRSSRCFCTPDIPRPLNDADQRMFETNRAEEDTCISLPRYI